MMRDIGGIFPISSVVSSETKGTPRAGYRPERQVRFLSLCREALSLIARRHAPLKRGRVLLPAYTCHTVIDPFLLNGWEAYYYSITEDLRINIPSLVELCRRINPDIVLVHPYHGMELCDDEIAALESIKTPSRIFVEDLTQCVFSTKRHSIFDYYVGSLRKWMPMPDGAFIASDRYDFVNGNLEDENNEYIATELSAMHLRYEYFKNGDDRIKAISRSVDKAAQAIISSSVNPHRMSSYAQSVCLTSDFSTIAERRMLNYQYLASHLQVPGVHVIGGEKNRLTTAPLYCPILVEDRALLVKKLVSARIYAPILWPLPSEDVLVNDAVRCLYASFLAIPIDQRYGVDDMARVCEVINS